MLQSMHRPILNHRLGLVALVAAALAFSITGASAAGHHGGGMRNPGLLSAPSAPPVMVTPPIEINTSGHNQPGAPNTSTPGIIGTGAMPSGLRGDSLSAPGFPAVVGQQ